MDRRQGGESLVETIEWLDVGNIWVNRKRQRPGQPPWRFPVSGSSLSGAWRFLEFCLNSCFAFPRLESLLYLVNFIAE
jgi:hypothetical protein